VIEFHCGLGAIVNMRLDDIASLLRGRQRLRLVRGRNSSA
jgi:hypothetical protein